MDAPAHYYMGLCSYTYSAGLTVATQGLQAQIERKVKLLWMTGRKYLQLEAPWPLLSLPHLQVDITTDAPLLDALAGQLAT